MLHPHGPQAEGDAAAEALPWVPPGYTLGMKTAVSIPDELFRRADELARRVGKSRSQVYQEALAEYLLRRDPAAVTQAMDEVLEDIHRAPDEWLSEAGRHTLERSEW
jgi:predicted transcriptional regulator